MLETTQEEQDTITGSIGVKFFDLKTTIFRLQTIYGLHI
jgi:hypothetical protein